MRFGKNKWKCLKLTHMGIHGQAVLPDTIEDAWKWKQLSGLLDRITQGSFEEIQKRCMRLGHEYRRKTAEYAEKSAWYQLHERVDRNRELQGSLNEWKQAVRRIGKGTGKRAGRWKEQARESMKKCQNAVPAWIMPVGRALESFTPGQNCFDVVIIDEASQSDLSSLAILYMGKKLIIVGDEQQVSPMAVGLDTDREETLRQIYLPETFPHADSIYEKTSIYDFAELSFPTVMLLEHFRCVPEIIGFSNMLSYKNKIRPLRAADSSHLLPAVVSYRVPDGERTNKKTNPAEARSIVALMKACTEQKEYAGKTFGVISMLGDEQVRTLQQEIFRSFSRTEIESRKILAGNAANFQGDERDVIFLSMVDSGNIRGGALKMMGDGAYCKRYNVAVSRARDQLWVVHSLDPGNDLKPGDLRRRLIDYVIDPSSAQIRHEQIEKEAESPFEAEVAKFLSDKGYHIVQQWKVGAYRIDMVAVCGKKMIAIECDGERYHSTETQIRADMERQTILERLGWRFIRIRGSEYFRSPDRTMKRVVEQLSEYGIEPEQMETAFPDAAARDSELFRRVKSRAESILRQEAEHISPGENDPDIAFALNPMEITGQPEQQTIFGMDDFMSEEQQRIANI